MERKVLFLSLILFALWSCSEGSHCPLCGESDTHYECDTVMHDVSLPILLEYGEPTTLLNGVTVIAYRNDAVVRETQWMRREVEVCSSCGHVIDRRYGTIYKSYKNVEFSVVRWHIEQVGSGKVLYELGSEIGCIIIK